MLRAEIYKALPGITIDVKLAFEQGILVLFGPSGAGKTTILNCLAGLQKPDRGLIALNDHVFYSSTDKFAIPARQRKIGYVFQDCALFPHMTVKDNALYGIPTRCKKGGCYRMSVLDVMEMLGITNLQNRYPSQLSGGEKQRVALARALMVEPDLLLLDEPLSALDFDTRKSLQAELNQLQKIWQIPFVLVTHSRKEMHTLADEILFIDKGCQTGYQRNDKRYLKLGVAV
jgi:molybdate transport system ATP-binding protein